MKAVSAFSASVTTSDLFSTSDVMCARNLLAATALTECCGEQGRELWVPQRVLLPNCGENDGDVCWQRYILGSMNRWRVNAVCTWISYLSFGSDSSSLEMPLEFFLRALPTAEKVGKDLLLWSCQEFVPVCPSHISHSIRGRGSLYEANDKAKACLSWQHCT